MKIYATQLGLIPSSEIAYLLRLNAERRRDKEEQQQRRAARGRERAARRRELWLRVRAGVGALRTA